MTDYRKNAAVAGSRGLRNNNPMNIRPFKVIYKGQTGVDNIGMAIFDTVEYGLRAGANELFVNYVKHGLNTITKQINDFAPPTENNTKLYIEAVSKQTGIGANTIFELDYNNVRKLMQAIINVELGSKYAKYVTANMIDDGIEMLQNTVLKKAGVSIGLILFIGLGIFLATQKSN